MHSNSSTCTPPVKVPPCSIPPSCSSFAQDPESQSLVVHSNLHDTYGSDGAADTEVPFK